MQGYACDTLCMNAQLRCLALCITDKHSKLIFLHSQCVKNGGSAGSDVNYGPPNMSR